MTVHYTHVTWTLCSCQICVDCVKDIWWMILALERDNTKLEQYSCLVLEVLLIVSREKTWTTKPFPPLFTFQSDRHFVPLRRSTRYADCNICLNVIGVHAIWIWLINMCLNTHTRTNTLSGQRKKSIYVFYYYYAWQTKWHSRGPCGYRGRERIVFYSVTSALQPPTLVKVHPWSY